MCMKYSTRRMLAENLRRLMNDNPDISSQTKLAKRASRPGGKKVGQTTIGIMLNPNHPVSPRLETIEAVADAIGIQVWQFLHPTLGKDGKAEEFMAKIALASPKERAVVYHLLAMDPITDYDVGKFIKPAPRKEKT